MRGRRRQARPEVIVFGSLARPLGLLLLTRQQLNLPPPPPTCSLRSASTLRSSRSASSLIKLAMSSSRASSVRTSINFDLIASSATNRISTRSRSMITSWLSCLAASHITCSFRLCTSSFPSASSLPPVDPPASFSGASMPPGEFVGASCSAFCLWGCPSTSSSLDSTRGTSLLHSPACTTRSSLFVRVPWPCRRPLSQSPMYCPPSL
eukprot:746991-Hanusia_phi.AAC.4